eukprot:2404328-Amphidinium_carterae.2
MVLNGCIAIGRSLVSILGARIWMANLPFDGQPLSSVSARDRTKVLRECPCKQQQERKLVRTRLQDQMITRIVAGLVSCSSCRAGALEVHRVFLPSPLAAVHEYKTHIFPLHEKVRINATRKYASGEGHVAWWGTWGGTQHGPKAALQEEAQRLDKAQLRGLRPSICSHGAEEARQRNRTSGAEF